MTYGKKTNGKLQVLGTGAGTSAGTVTLTNLEVVSTDNSKYFITFKAGSETGQVYFTK